MAIKSNGRFVGANKSPEVDSKGVYVFDEVMGNQRVKRWPQFGTPTDFNAYIVSGGGGGGSAYGGGGGAGGFLSVIGTSIVRGTTYAITIGAGGLGGYCPLTGAPYYQGSNGFDSSVGALTSPPGGGGGAAVVTLGAVSGGGSGGGGSGLNSGYGGVVAGGTAYSPDGGITDRKSVV